ncbi:Alanine--tRNA ligase, partial [Lachnellula suecica]
MTQISAPTYLAFQYNGSLRNLNTTVLATHPVSSLSESNRLLFKAALDTDHVVITPQTIFHPQGGGQPSDIGSMHSTANPAAKFDVLSVRMDAEVDGQVLHFGRFVDLGHVFTDGEEVEQAVDAEKRELYSRLHTAGHVLGAAVRHLLEDKIEGFDELKASHFPDAASCEFKGLIDGKWKGDIQKRVDEYVDKSMPVEIHWWGKEDF